LPWQSALHRSSQEKLWGVESNLWTRPRGMKGNLITLKHASVGQTVAFASMFPCTPRAKMGINIHNRGDLTVGSYRLFDLPGNGVMPIADGE